jgi:uncharacterized membrane protein
MPKNRLEAYSDCIIAFAITLLILGIQIPDMGAARVDNPAMLKAIFGLLPNFAVYVISFVVCTVWWISHHTFIDDLHSVDRRLLWLNSLFLMLIAFIPFPTGLLGHHPGQPIATAFYGLVCALTGFSFWLLRWYSSTQGELMKPEIPMESTRRRVRISLCSACFGDFKVEAARVEEPDRLSRLGLGFFDLQFRQGHIGPRFWDGGNSTDATP